MEAKYYQKSVAKLKLTPIGSKILANDDYNFKLKPIGSKMLAKYYYKLQ